MAETDDTRRTHERLADNLYILSMSDDLIRGSAIQQANELLSSKNKPGVAARALDLLRVATLTKDPIDVRSPSYLTVYTYSSREDAFWKAVWDTTEKHESFEPLTDDEEYDPAKSLPCRYVSLLMYLYSEQHNIRVYSQMRNIKNLTEGARKYRKSVSKTLEEDKKTNRFICLVATKEVTNGGGSKLHWRLLGGRGGIHMFIPYQYLLHPWTQVNLDGTSKKKAGQDKKTRFFWVPRVCSEFYWVTQIKPVFPVKVSRLLLRNLPGVRFVCDGNIGIHWFNDELSVRTCTFGMNFKGLSALALDSMPLECIVWRDMPTSSLTSLSITDTSSSNMECEGQFVDGEWASLTCGPDFKKLGVIKMFNNNFGLVNAECPRLRELHYGARILSGIPGDEFRDYYTTTCPQLDARAPLKKLVFMNNSPMRLTGTFPMLHRVEEEANVPLYPTLKTLKFVNVGVIYGSAFLETLRYINDGNIGPKVIEIDNLFEWERRSALGMEEDGPPIEDNKMDQDTFDFLFSTQVNCTSLTVVNMPRINSIKEVTKHMSKLASLEIKNLEVSEGLSMENAPIKSLTKVKHVGIKWDSPTRIALAAKSPKKSKQGKSNVQENVNLSPQRSPPPLVPNVQFDPILDDDDEQGPDLEELRQDYLDQINGNLARCFGSPWTNFQGAPSNIQWPPWYTDIDPNGPRSLEYLESFLKWETESMRWITGEDWEMIHVVPAPEGDLAVADVKDPEEGFGFDVIAFQDLRSDRPRSIFLETGVGLNASESGLFYQDHVFTFEASFLSQDDVFSVEDSKFITDESTQTRTFKVMADRTSLLDSLRNGLCSFSFPITRGARHLGFLQAADLGVEDVDFQEGMNVESVTDKIAANLLVQSFVLSKKAEPGMASGVRYIPTSDPNEFQVEYADETLRADLSYPVGAQNQEFVMNLGTLIFGENGSFKFSFECNVPVRLLGIQCFKALGFYSQRAWEERIQKMGQKGKASPQSEEEEEMEEARDPLPKLFRTIAQDGMIPDSSDAIPFRLVPDGPFLAMRVPLVTALNAAQQVNALPLPQMNEEQWAMTQGNVGRFSRQAALIFMYTMGRGMQSILSMPHFRGQNPVGVQFSRIFQFYISPIMRWCCQDYPRDMAPSMDLISYRFDDIMGLLASANNSWTTQDKPNQEEGENKKFAMNLYSTVVSGSRQLINDLQEFCDPRTWQTMDRAITSALTTFQQMDGVIFRGQGGDASKLKSKLSGALTKALGSSSGRAKGTRGSKKKIAKGAGGVIDGYYGDQENINQLIVEQATAPQDLTPGLLMAASLENEDDDDDDFIVEEEEETPLPSTPSSGERTGGSPYLMEISPMSPLDGAGEVMRQMSQLISERKQRPEGSPSYSEIKGQLFNQLSQRQPMIIFEEEEEEEEEMPPTPVFKQPQQKKGKKKSPLGKKRRKQFMPKRKILLPPDPPDVQKIEKDLLTKRRATGSPDVSPAHSVAKKRIKAREASPQQPQMPPPFTMVIEAEKEVDEEEEERVQLDLASFFKDRARNLKTAEAIKSMSPAVSGPIPPRPTFGMSPSGVTEVTPPIFIKARQTSSSFSSIATLDGREVQAFGPPQATTPLLQQRTTDTSADKLARENTELKRQLDEARMREMATLKSNLERERAKNAALERRLAEREQRAQKEQEQGFTDLFTLERVCAVCESNQIKGQCPRCKVVFYCGSGHYKEHYSEHKKECKGMPQ